MEQVPQKNWTMKHPALAKAFAVAFAVMSLIMAAAGFNGIGEAKEENSDRLRYEKKYAERIDNYAELSKKLENSITYEELWEELEKEVEQHDKDSSQHKTDLALNTAERGGYTMGANMIWEAVPDFNASRRELAIAKQMLETKAGEIALLREAVDGMSALEAGAQTCAELLKKLEMINSAMSPSGGLMTAAKPNEGNTVVEEHQHDWGEGTVVTASSCTVEGRMSYSCGACGATKEEAIAVAEHDWGEGTVVTESSCTSEGRMSYSCGACGATKEEAIAVAEHDWGEGTVVTESSCTSEGRMSYSCGACDATKEEAIAVAEHSWDGGVVTVEATVDAEGSISYACTACGATKTESIPKLKPVVPANVPDEPEAAYAKKNVRISYTSQGGTMVDPVDTILAAAQKLAYGIEAMGMPLGEITKDNLGQMLGTMQYIYENALKAAEADLPMTLEQMRAALKAYDDGVAAIKAGEAGLNMAWGQLENIWYELGQLEDERDELEINRDRLNEEAAKLSKEVMEADELHELENDRTSAKLLLTSVKEVKDMVNGGAEIIPSAQQYLEDYKAQTKLQYTGRLISCALAIIGGIAGLAGIPAVYEFTRKRVWLIAPVVVCAVFAALAEGIYYGVGLGWWYVGMFTAIIALLHLLIVLPKEKKPGTVK